MPMLLAGCYDPHIVNEQDAYYCETQGFRAGSDANVACATKRAADREQSGNQAVEQVVAMAQQTAPPPPSHGGGVAQVTPIDVAYGGTATVNFSISVNATCTVVGAPTITIVKQPAHGTARVVPREDLARFSPSNYLETCAGRKVWGLALEYTPAKGYSGLDTVEFETSTKSGLRRFSAPITVEKQLEIEDP